MGWSWKKMIAGLGVAGHEGGGGLSVLDRPEADAGFLADPDFHAEVDRALAEVAKGASLLVQRFGATVDTLCSLNDRGRALVSSSERLVEIASGRHTGVQVLFDGMGLIEGPLKYLSEFQSRFEGERVLERLVDDLGLIQDCLRAEAEINRTMEPLRTVRTLFKVVAAPLGEAVHQIFESLVEELSELHEQSRALVGTKFQEMVRVRGLLDALLAGLRTQRTYWTELARQRSEMESSLAGLESQIVANAQRDTRIGSTSKRISSAIEQVVTGLQWQDIVNQKLEHVDRAVKGILAKLRAGDVALPVLNQAARLELAQLHAARRDLSEAESSIRDGLGRVIDELKQSDSSVVLLSEFQLLTTSSSGVVQLLLDSIESIDSQLGAVLRSADDSMRTIDEIRAAAASLTSAVRELSERTLLVGLNAQVQACKVSQGAGLGVLSARTSDVSGLVSRIGDSVAAKLRRITENLAACGEIFTGLTAHAEERCGDFRASRGRVETSLHALRDEAFQLVQSTGGALEEIDRVSTQAIDGARYMEAVDREFAVLEAILGRMIEASGGESFAADLNDPVFADALRSYTMASEREVFAAMSRGTPAAEAVAAVSSGASTIDLFDGPDDRANPDRPDRPDQPTEAKDRPGDVELF